MNLNVVLRIFIFAFCRHWKKPLRLLSYSMAMVIFPMYLWCGARTTILLGKRQHLQVMYRWLP